MKNDSHRSNVPAKSPPPKSCRTGETCRRSRANERRASEIGVRRDSTQHASHAILRVALHHEISHGLRQHPCEHRREKERRHAAADQERAPSVTGKHLRRDEAAHARNRS